MVWFLIRGEFLNMFKNGHGYSSTTTVNPGYNTDSYGPLQIDTNDAGSYPWLIRRPFRECVTGALRYVLVMLLVMFSYY